MEAFDIFRRKRINLIMDKYNLDSLVGSLPENIYYLSDFKSISHGMMNHVQAYALYDRKNESALLVLPIADVSTFIEQRGEMSVRCYGDFYFEMPEVDSSFTKKVQKVIEEKFTTPEEALIESIKNMNIKKGRIGIDQNKIPPQSWNTLVDNFPDLEFIEAGNIFGEIRMVKHNTEVHKLERAAEITENALYSSLSKLEMGMTEKQIADLYISEIVKQQGLPFFNVITEGERAAFSDTICTNRNIKMNSLLRFDIGCIYEEYRSDIARTAVIGDTSSKVKDYYKYILEGEMELIEHIKPGVTAGEIFNLTVEKVRKGIPQYKRHHVGHGIGLEIYEPPMLIKNNDMVLEPGMVLSVETPFYELEWGGIQVEDTIVVTDKGCKMLTKSNNNLIEMNR